MKQYKQLEFDLLCSNIEVSFRASEVSSRTSEVSSRTSELRERSHQILSHNYNSEQKKKKLLTYIIQNEKSF